MLGKKILSSIVVPAKKQKKNTWVFIHGLLGAGCDFLDAAKTDQLSKHSEIHLIDLRNHGKNEKSPPTSNKRALSLEQHSSDIRQYINHHRIGEVNIFGYSFGGLVACELCSNPEFNKGIKSLLLGDMGPFPYNNLHKYPDAKVIFYQMYDLNKIQMTGTTALAIREAINDITDDVVVQDYYFKNVVALEKEGDFTWKNNLELIVRTCFYMMEIKQKGVFEGKVCLFKALQSRICDVKEDQYLLKQYFPNFDHERDTRHVDTDHMLHFKEFDWFVNEFEKYNQTVFF